MSRKKFLVAALLFAALSALVFAQNTAFIERYLQGASDQYANHNNEKAYQYINYVLDRYDAETVPGNALILAQAIYYDYLADIRTRNDEVAFRQFQNQLLEVPYVADERLSKQLRQVTAYFISITEKAEREAAAAAQSEQVEKTSQIVAQAAQEASQAAIAASERRQREEAESTAKAMRDANEELYRRIEGLSSSQRELTEEFSGSQQHLVNSLLESLEANQADSRQRSERLLIILSVIAGLFILVIILVIVSVTMARKQQALFTQTLRVVSELQRIPLEQSSTLQLTETYAGMRAIEEAGAAPSRAAIAQFEHKEVNDELRTELRELAAACEAEGVKIDKATSRKNNSKNVAEMVFKIAQQMNLGEYTSMLYFCAGMVYDIGFLALDKGLLQNQSLTDEEKYEIRSHVKKGVDLIGFVPEKFRPVFVEAILFHHENLDGTGYPDGVSDKKIPLVAQIIHVVESFIAQISKRNYRGIFDKETAITELRAHPERYDLSIVDALDALI